jgi:hypothetical protein
VQHEHSKDIGPDAFTEAMADFCKKLADNLHILYERLRPEDGGERDAEVAMAVLADALTLFLVGLGTRIEVPEEGDDKPPPFDPVNEFMGKFLPNIVELGAGFVLDEETNPEQYEAMVSVFEDAAKPIPDEKKH